MITASDPILRPLLRSESEVVFLLDAHLCFLECSPAWDSFAGANGGRGISREEILGRNILDCIPQVLRKFYEQKYWLVDHGSESEFDYHCSSPEKIRIFRMSIRSLGSEILVVNRLTLEEECETNAPLTAPERQQYVSPSGLLSMCANCRKVRKPGTTPTWMWIPEFLNEKHLPITHGLCPRCLLLLYGDLETQS